MKSIYEYDFHSHILPSLDDGAKNINVSLSLIKSEIKQGVKHICFTPHFYQGTNIDLFIKNRNLSFEELKNNLTEDETNSLNFYLGAEVAFNYDTQIDEPGKLCISNTDLILLELPFSSWGDWVTEKIFEFSSKYNVTPIIAHADRYTNSSECVKILNKLADMNVLMQFNTNNLDNNKTLPLIKKLLNKEEIMPLFGSDAHDAKMRDVSLAKLNSLRYKLSLGSNYINLSNDFAKELLSS